MGKKSSPTTPRQRTSTSTTSEKNDRSASTTPKAKTTSSSSPFSSLQFSSLFNRRQKRNSGSGIAPLEQQQQQLLDDHDPDQVEGRAQDSPGGGGTFLPSSTEKPSWSSMWGSSSRQQRQDTGSMTASGSGSSSLKEKNADTGATTLPRAPRSRRSSAFASLLSPREDEPEEVLDPLLTHIYSHPEHVAAFAEALRDDAGQQEPAAATSALAIQATSSLLRFGVGSGSNASQMNNKDKNSERSELQPGEAKDGDSILHDGASHDKYAEPTATQPAQHPRRVGRIAAASDFAPVRERTKRRRRRDKGSKGSAVSDGGSREGLLYSLFRFPLLVAIFITIALEFAAYVLIRQIVNIVEYAIAWRGEKGRLRKQLRKAQTGQEWRDVALEIDEFLGYEAWKREDASSLYDWILVKKVVHSLRSFREKDDADNLIGVLELCLRNNFAGTENFRLYSETYYGTKYLIESYLAELEAALEYVQRTSKLSLETKRSFYRGVQKNLGRSALCLSGGGSFGYYHIGLVKALLDANLLPSIITGTSAGGLIAALACTRTNDELKRLLVPELADRITACEEPFRIWGPRAFRTGARFDLVQWAEKAQFFTMGSLTFAEAYARTGKVLNISVIPADRHSPVKLLNYHTAPNCIIWSSLLASAAVPGILNPVCLMQKTKSGQAVPWNWGHRFKDGSLRVDIPLQDLHSLFNVNYPIVSQVNPHVHLFFFAPKGMPGRPVAHRRGKGWRGGFLLSASEHVLKLHLSMNFKIIRDLDLLPAILGQDWSSVFLQQFGGAVTIWPKTRAWDWVRILTDPDRKELTRMMRVGLSVTFPKLHMIENRVRLERAIETGRRATRSALRSKKGRGALVGAGASLPMTPSSTNRGGGPLSPAATAGGSQAGGLDSMPMSMAASQDGLEKRPNLSDTDGTNEEASSYKPPMPGPLHRLHSEVGTPGYATTPDEIDKQGGFPIEATTPGELLPRDIRQRSLGMDDVAELRSKLGVPDEGDDEEDGASSSPSAHGEFVANDFAMTPRKKQHEAIGEPLTAAALSPMRSNVHGHGHDKRQGSADGWSTRGSIRRKDETMRWLNDRGASMGELEDDDGNGSDTSSSSDADD